MGQGDALIPFVSCFGALALYNPEAFRLCEYDEAGDDCEHVGFHMCMRRKGMRGPHLDPYLVTRYDSAHNALHMLDPKGKCQMCPSADVVRSTPFHQRWDKWERLPDPGIPVEDQNICRLSECKDKFLAPTRRDDQLPCFVHGTGASLCTCVDLLVGGSIANGLCDCG